MGGGGCFSHVTPALVSIGCRLQCSVTVEYYLLVSVRACVLMQFYREVNTLGLWESERNRRGEGEGGRERRKEKEEGWKRKG